VIHRDFKSPNVMLVPRGDHVRAVITDFGLARGAVGEHFGVATTDQAGLVGSPAYMAPEQVAGLEVTAAADSYALGVVMFEMVTARWPFEDKTAVLTALKRLHEPPPSPRMLAPTLDERWERVILRCLEREPEARFAAIDGVLAALIAPPPETPAPMTPPKAGDATRSDASRASPTRWPWIALGAATLGLAGVGLRGAGRPPASIPQGAAPPRTQREPPRTVGIAIRTEPPEAELLIDGIAVTNPVLARRAAEPRTHEIRARAPGFEEHVQTVQFDEDVTLIIRMTRASSPAAPRARRHGSNDPALDHFITTYPGR
jgi:hypothetical protein